MKKEFWRISISPDRMPPPKTVFEFVNRMAMRDMTASPPLPVLRLHVGRETLVSSWENTWTSVETSLTIVSSSETHVSHMWKRTKSDCCWFRFHLLPSNMGVFTTQRLPFEYYGSSEQIHPLKFKLVVTAAPHVPPYNPSVGVFFLDTFFPVTNFSANWCKELQSSKRHHSRPESIFKFRQKKVSGYWLQKLLLRELWSLNLLHAQNYFVNEKYVLCIGN